MDLGWWAFLLDDVFRVVAGSVCIPSCGSCVGLRCQFAFDSAWIVSRLRPSYTVISDASVRVARCFVTSHVMVEQISSKGVLVVPEARTVDVHTSK